MTKQIVETKHHLIEFDSKKTLKKVVKFCDENNIDLDYYFEEFDLSPVDPDLIIEYDTE